MTIKFRLYCESCTGIALYGEKAIDGAKVACQSCGKETPVKKENWIALSEEEIERLNRPVTGMKVGEVKHKDK